MNREIRFALLLIVLIFALNVASYSQPVIGAQHASAASISMQVTTPTPSVEDKSEIGSTDGIFVMGIMLVAITSLPILLRHKK